MDFFLELYVLLLGSNYTYVWITSIIGWFGYDKFFRKKFVIHLCMEEGNSLYEIKRFWIPLKKIGTELKWTISKKHGETEGRAYTVDSKNVLFTDRFNKMHIIHPYDNVFGYHPFADKDGVHFTTIAKANAEHFYTTIAKGGILHRTEGIRNKLKPDKTGMIFGVLIGAGIAYMIINIVSGMGFHIINVPLPPPEITTTTTTTNPTSLLRTIFTGVNK